MMSIIPIIFNYNVFDVMPKSSDKRKFKLGSVTDFL